MILPAIGTFREDLGGWIGAYISLNQDGIATHALIVADKSTQFSDMFGPVSSTTPSNIDGPGNFASLLAESKSPAVHVQTNLNDADHGGHDDWYIPARLELAAIYWALKPTSDSNATGILAYDNDYAVPQYVQGDWSSSNPAQTDVPEFQSVGSQAYDSATYASSTLTASITQQRINFQDGGRSSGNPAGTSRYRAVRRVPVSEVIDPPPTEEEIFQASFEDASGRDPLPTALVERTSARQLANHNVIVYKYPPYLVTKRLPIELSDYDLTEPGKMMWHQDDDDPLFAMGRWAQIQSRSLGDDPIEVELTLRISDHPESFTEPT